MAATMPVKTTAKTKALGMKRSTTEFEGRITASTRDADPLSVAAASDELLLSRFSDIGSPQLGSFCHLITTVLGCTDRSVH